MEFSWVLWDRIKECASTMRTQLVAKNDLKSGAFRNASMVMCVLVAAADPGAVAFLFSDDEAWVGGQVWSICGGMSLRDREATERGARSHETRSGPTHEPDEGGFRPPLQRVCQTAEAVGAGPLSRGGGPAVPL